MAAVRFRIIALAAAAMPLALAVECVKARTDASASARQMAQAVAHLDSLAAATRSVASPDAVGEQSALAVGYLERLRLGLGSPFRLIDYALHDRRLADSLRVRVAWALLARTVAGEAYRGNPTALDYVGGAEAQVRAGVGLAHRVLIDSVIAASRDPRAGELAVRLAYAIAAAEGSVGRWASSVSAQAAALARDRALAARDAKALLRSAAAERIDPLALVGAWRAERRFAVERPLLGPLSPRLEQDAIVAAPRLVASLRHVARQAMLADSGTTPPHDARPLLGVAAALRLAEGAATRAMPPQAPVVLAVQTQRRLFGGFRLRDEDRTDRARFVRYARNEESLAAAHAIAVQTSRGGSPEAALATQRAAVALRAYAQEPVWFPGDAAPTALELKRQFGFAAISFDDDVPASWRPYYLRMLALAAADVHRVLPEIPLRGLGVHFGEVPREARAIALHDPRTRTVFLPIGTSAGAIAHELAHDLDWHAEPRGGYSTDRAIREREQRVAAPLWRLAAAALGPVTPENLQHVLHGQRPTELFARNVDWFVAVSLAREGRMNGYLSAVQDELLTGYVMATPPDISGDAGHAIVDLLEGMTAIAAPVRSAFLDQYGRARSATAYDVVRRLLEIPAPDPSTLLRQERMRSWAARIPVMSMGDSPLGASQWCDARPAAERGVAVRADGTSDRAAEMAAARRRLLELAASARAQRILRDWERRVPSDRTDLLAVRALRGGPWSPALVEDALSRISAHLLERVEALDAARRAVAGSGAAWAMLGVCGVQEEGRSENEGVTSTE